MFKFNSIHFKLWLAIAIPLIALLAILLSVNFLQLKKRFIHYSQQAAAEQLPSLSNRLAEIYEQRGSFAPFKHKPPLWQKVVGRSLNLAPPHRPPKPRPHDKKPHKAKPPERREPHIEKNQQAFARSLTLYNSERQYISGNTKPADDIQWLAVESQNKIVGWISYEPPKTILRKSGQRFLLKQLHFFLWASLGLTLAAALIAALIARWLTKPLKAIKVKAQEVGQGNFSVRLNYQSSDELGTLCTSFNSMVEQLEQSEELRRRWFADISHELRTPVSVLKAQIEAMIDGVRPSDSDNLGVLNKQIKQMQQLIDDIFTLALGDAQALSLRRERVDIDVLLQDFKQSQASRCSQQGFEFRLLTDNEPLSCNIDAQRFEQVLNNLVSNSLSYSDAPGHIQWTLKRQHDHIELLCEDSSPGVSKHELQKIFERMHRVEKSRSRASGGAGLGLALCKTIIENHGGSIEAQASSLGGLAILIKLPS
ncbi:ATP-binding protein [Agaribacterium sp. ZY112]|uniref:ATP-binding protein n=1 Tax=Agaribacterium sp. ZY112 TaxID=3233574 RepID=UPI003524AF93